MDLRPREWALLIIGAAVVGVGAWVTVGKTGAPGTDSGGYAPRREPGDPLVGATAELSLSGLNASANMLGIDAAGGFTFESRLIHFFEPDSPMPWHPATQRTVTLPHRYPTESGTNINTLIHRGYSPLMVPSARDYDWLVNPPADQEFGG